MTVNRPDSIKVAVVQAASVLMDLEATTEKACRLIEDASASGARVIVFPEVFLGGYPRGLHFASVVGNRLREGRADWARYWRSAVAVPSETTERIAQAAAKANAYVVMGIVERETTGTGGTLYNTVVYFSPEGALLGLHRKLKPTALERLIWGEGDGSTLTVVDTPYGRLGGLICWENYMPLARMAMYMKGVALYVAPTADARDSWQATLQHIACEGRCFVLAANQYITKDMYPTDLACYAELESQPEEMCRGGSAIVDPFGAYLAGPLFHQEGILTAELDLSLREMGLFDFDVTGHYARPDIFEFRVRS
jgi:nitrilase